MSRPIQCYLLVILLVGFVLTDARLASAQEAVKTAAHRGPECLAVDHFFADEVWAKVGERTCLKCHNATGDASDSEFILRDTSDRTNREAAMRHNRDAFQRVASAKEGSQSLLLSKIAGGLDHGGGEVLKTDSTGYRILKRFVRRATGLPDDGPAVADYDAPPFFDGIEMMSPRRLLRRVTLSLVGRLPTKDEQAAVKKDGLPAMDAILDDVMKEDAFFVRLREAFNDILLTEGYTGNGEIALRYTHFHKSRQWYRERDPNKDRGPDEKLKYSHPLMQAYTKLVREYRQAIRREPLELVAHIVRNDLPFTEIVTADYTMVSPYSSRGYGIFEEVSDSFKDPDDPFEFIPVKLKALTDDKSGKVVQDSETGFYPHAGVLSTFQYLKRYPTTETNRNRLRVRMYFEHFLGVDILQLAPRVSDAAAASAKYAIPTMQAADCVVCHKVIDPIAGLFQDYYAMDVTGLFGPRKEGWYKDMFAPGLEDEGLPADEKWRSLQWLGERTAKDPRFAVAMVNHVWYILAGRKPLLPPEDIDDPMFAAKRRAYRMQRDEIEQIAARFAESTFNLKVVFKELAQSKFYRADGLAKVVFRSAKERNFRGAKGDELRRLAELDDVGVARLLTPEQLERKLNAIFGSKWGRLTDQESKFGILYGGIDSREITQRNTEPSGAMGAIQRIMANDIACQNVATDFSLPANERRLFPGIEPNVAPGASAQADAQIQLAIVHLHELVLGRFDKPDDPEVHRTYDLFAGIVKDAKSRKGIQPLESYYCQSGREVTPRDADPDYTIRGWRAVVTYLLRQH